MSFYDLYLKPETSKKQITKSVQLVPPPGYTETPKKVKGSKDAERIVKNYDLQRLKMRKAWEMAYSPAKNIPMNLVMMYFSPNTLQLIPIMMTLMLFVNPLKEIWTVNQTFNDLDIGETNEGGYDRFLMKVLYTLCSLGTMAVGVWKLNGMGLIPNSSSDWLAWEAPTIGQIRSIVI
ncbi:unnamed protein product [Kuraishia capsulata CBS 1993]|uniref:ER membrane protein complex subunit 4 n=1 Tax=Kuraishia capsulata CBS 1993 TaxID=1382522 RepID=W6MY21_9ASCO|nr:uncharacterized protein KUCA_T00005869001 [Kuraishia capsulata CBS 1993]CDK29875.1 unnamed protein product [Kuraishia capsulata CBS 1993]